MCDEKVRLHGLDLSTISIVDDSREPESERALRKRLSDWVMSRPSVSPEYEKAPLGCEALFSFGGGLQIDDVTGELTQYISRIYLSYRRKEKTRSVAGFLTLNIQCPSLMSNIHKNGNIANIMTLNYAIFITSSLFVTLFN
ncbi:hypothetical protein L7F45_003430 [Salmonella enterica subsp. enterica serovar Mgulani]|nr:hypothetical protein [Salmonella enterica subsp. enterica serovar Mgulani]